MDSLQKIKERGGNDNLNGNCMTDRLNQLRPNEERLSTDFDDIGVIVFPQILQNSSEIVSNRDE